MGPKLELRNVRKAFADVPAVTGLSLALARGEFFSLLGPSGCGKSTTLALAAGFLKPDSGEIVVDGQIVNDVPPQRRRIGLVFQDYAVFTRLTVRANLAFGLEAKGTPRKERRRAIEALAARLGLMSLMDRVGAGLNMSEMQRVALARTLITEPELLLLDEPMSNLDAGVRARLRGDLRQIQKSLGQTVLYVTHDQAEALSMSDRIGVMQGGRLLQVAAPEEIYRRPVNRFVAEFIGDPPINVIPCGVRRNGSTLRIDVPGWTAFSAQAPIEPGPHLLAIRPHDIEIADEGAPGALAATVRFVENFGAERVLHVAYQGDLLRVSAPPPARAAGDVAWLRFDPSRAHLIERTSEAVIPLCDLEMAA